MKELIEPEVNRIFECDIKLKSRLRVNVFGRMAFCNYLKENVVITITDMARYLKMNHATVIYYLKEHKQLYKYDADYRKRYDRLKTPTVEKTGFCNLCILPNSMCL